MQLRGRLIAESPIYRGNARKTLFTRDGDGTQRLVSLAGEVSGTAQALMDAFIGQSRDGRNSGLLNRLWQRLYGTPFPEGLITRVECKLNPDSYPRDHFFDLRMGLRLDPERWAAEANANYKMETVFRNAVFDFTLTVNDTLLQQGDNAARLRFVLDELRAGRFWFGAGKSKGLGRVRLEMDIPFGDAGQTCTVNGRANHLRIGLSFSAINPVLVGWNWGKVDPEVPSFAAIEGRLLVEAMRDLPEPIRSRVAMAIGGPILSPENWKQKFAETLPRVIAVWLREQSTVEREVWILREKPFLKLAKGKQPLGKQVVEATTPLLEKPFPSQEALKTALTTALGDKAHMARRILEIAESERQVSSTLNHEAWKKVAEALGLDATLETQLVAQWDDPSALTTTLAAAVKPILPRLFAQVDQQINLLQSDAWVDAELATREQHVQIKQLLLEGKITEADWNNRSQPPAGISAAAWRTFLDEHSRVRYQHITHPANLRKSITNDRNFIAFLKAYRERTRQELAQPQHIDFRAGGPFNREVSRKYGKPYDTIFMRMLTWAPSAREQGAWEIYIPGSTIKGAFRKRAEMVLQTLWGDSPRKNKVLDRLFGTQGKRGLVFFSDAYLLDPNVPQQAWCSMDGVRMDPATGRPIETAKRDYLFAYGDRLTFRLQLDLLDIGEDDLEAVSILVHLLDDFARGDIPIGGEKTSGFGWVRAHVTEMVWLTTPNDGGLSQRLFGDYPLQTDGLWRRLELKGVDARLQVAAPLEPQVAGSPQSFAPAVPKAKEGFISHRAFGGYCGTLVVELEVLTPLHIRESGEPSFETRLDDSPVNGWDAFSMAPPDAALRPTPKLYALPSRSLKGMLRHIYAIASDSRKPSPDLSNLNPTDRLFGFVGTGPNQALMGRLVFDFALFDSPTLAWFKTPYPYSGWIYEDGRWVHRPGQSVPLHQIAKTWRVFYHAPLAPIVQRLDDFQVDTVQASYFRAILPGARAKFTIRFWNLEKEELERLVWCVTLEPNLAHKLGLHRYLGFGSVRLHLLPESFLIQWGERYASTAEAEWKQPLVAAQWLNPQVIAHYDELRSALDASAI